MIKVVDAVGHPVAGAVIKPDGLRPKKNSSHYFWGDNRIPKAETVTTGADGYAEVPYPFYVEEKLETGQISFSVDHPDFCADRPFATVTASPPANAPTLEKAKFAMDVALRRVRVRPDPIVLQKGAIVQVSGFIGEPNAIVSNVAAKVTGVWGAAEKDWRSLGAGRIESRRVPAGFRALWLVYVPEHGPIHFSDIETFGATSGKTNFFHLRLAPGARLNGELDGAVTRPIQHGHVVLEVIPPHIILPDSRLHWHAWAPIESNGTFTVDSLPPGTVEIVALGDGFVSADEPGGRSDRSGGVIRWPQGFELDSPRLDITLKTEPSATLEVTVLDDQRQPLQGAEVSLWPNVIWSGRGTTIFGSGLYNSADYYRTHVRPSFNTDQIYNSDNYYRIRVRPSFNTERHFFALTDQRGVAVVSNLPANANAFAVRHTSFDLPIRRDSSGAGDRYWPVTLTPGQTNRTTVLMEKRGTEFIQH